MGFRDWLNPYCPFEQARGYARGLALTSDDEWRRFIRGQMPEKGKLPDNIPVLPHDVYKDSGWLSWGDWLGTEKAASDRSQK